MLPEGLEWCPVCGDPRGVAPDGGESLCFCDGILCRYCGAARTRRPISDHYDPRDGRWWHTPYFGAMIPCPHCTRLARTVEPHGSFPGPLRNDLRISLLLAGVREASQALRSPTDAYSPDAVAPPGGLLAVHGEPWVWERLGQPASPPERPLQLTSASLRSLPALLHDALGIATWANRSWRSPVPIEEALRARWRPPFDEHDATPAQG